MNNIDFYFSIGSTYTYLSVTRALEAEKQHQIKFSWTPFSVRAIMKEMNNVPFPKEKKNKVDYMWRDIERRAKNYGFFAKTPVPYPLTEFDLANKIAILGLKNNWGVDYVQLTYKQASSEEVNNIYLSNTEKARKNKIFGSPSFVVKNEIFWGDDRMEDAIKWSKANE